MNFRKTVLNCLLTALAVVTVIALLAGCAGKGNNPEPTAENSENSEKAVLFKLSDGTPVYEFCYERFLFLIVNGTGEHDALLSRFSGKNAGGEETQTDSRFTAARAAAGLAAEISMCQKEGVKDDDPAVTATYENALKEVSAAYEASDFEGSEDEFSKGSNGVTKDEFATFAAMLKRTELLAEKLASKADAGSEAVAKYVEENRDRFFSAVFAYAYFKPADAQGKTRDAAAFTEWLKGVLAEVSSAEDMTAFVEKYSESDGKSEDAVFFYDKSGTDSSVAAGEALERFFDGGEYEADGKYVIEDAGGFYALYCLEAGVPEGAAFEESVADEIRDAFARSETENYIRPLLEDAEAAIAGIFI